jgi:hypothetical protein
MSAASQGRAREHRVRDHMADAGWLPIMRSAGSKGAADLLLAHPDHGAALVQVGTANKRLGPADRGRLLHAAALCGALPLLAVAARSGITYWWVSAGPARTWEAWTP